MSPQYCFLCYSYCFAAAMLCWLAEPICMRENNALTLIDFPLLYFTSQCLIGIKLTEENVARVLCDRAFSVFRRERERESVFVFALFKAFLKALCERENLMRK
ncbi:hypothetical protein SO802_024003 [Lithocarpus litseifolius]|uniref:Secreted protein n=1 Tax=Lithocarpus litseifolius TaxID=425828 RepID=A0AAW2CBA6_9ROSI